MIWWKLNWKTGKRETGAPRERGQCGAGPPRGGSMRGLGPARGLGSTRRWKLKTFSVLGGLTMRGQVRRLTFDLCL